MKVEPESPSRLEKIRSMENLGYGHKKTQSHTTLAGLSGQESMLESSLQYRQKFGDSERKISDNSYFSSFLDLSG